MKEFKEEFESQKMEMKLHLEEQNDQIEKLTKNLNINIKNMNKL